MTFVNTDIFGENSGGLLGSAGDDFGGDLRLPDYNPSTSPDVLQDFGGELFNFGKDVLSGYLNLKSNELLISEELKLAQAQRQQQAMLNTVETGPDVEAYTLQPDEVAMIAQRQSGGSNDMMLYAVIAVAVAVVVL